MMLVLQVPCYGIAAQQHQIGLSQGTDLGLRVWAGARLQLRLVRVAQRPGGAPGGEPRVLQRHRRTAVQGQQPAHGAREDGVPAPPHVALELDAGQQRGQLLCKDLQGAVNTNYFYVDLSKGCIEGFNPRLLCWLFSELVSFPIR